MKKWKKNSESPYDIKGIRDQLLGDFPVHDIRSETRDVSVMTRLSKSSTEILDSLVKLSIFRSRSEAIASIIERTILRKIDLFQQLNEQAEKLDEIQDSAKELAFKALTSKD
ncbi:MAG: hypothetical protein ACFFCP_14540 [Promethearchaeota archaeon]